MNEEKRLSLREQLEKITDSPFRAGTAKSLTDAHGRTKEEQLRADYIKHRLSSTTTIVLAEGIEAAEARAASEKVSDESPSVSAQSPRLDA